MQRICGSLAAAGYRVQLVGWQRPASPPLTPQPYQQHRLRGWFQKGKLFYLEYNLRLFFYLLSQRAAAWCACDLDTALPVWLRARLGGQPFVYDAHELFTEVPEVVARPAVQRVWRWVEVFIVPRARLAYTVGPALARVFEQRYGRPFAVVRNVSRLRGDEPAISSHAEPNPAAAATPEAGSSETPDVSAAMPGIEDAMPGIGSAQLGIVSAMPGVASAQPDVVGAMPDFMDAMPDVVGAMPGVMNELTGNSTEMPGISAGTTGISTETIGIASAQPSISTEKPYVITEKPNARASQVTIVPESVQSAAPAGGYILYQGALNVGRGLENLLEAMPQVAGRLVICGEGDLSAALREQAERLGLLASGQVEFRGFVLPEALREVTRHAAVGIMLLENIGLSYYYSLANKFFDYVHAGIPQVLIDFPEYRALNDEFDVAELVSNLAPATLAAALNRLLRDEPARYQHLAANCRRAAPQLSWQHEERELRRLWAGVVPINA